jgi:23S rRNA (cytosine1962-C5)-methyltransferase
VPEARSGGRPAPEPPAPPAAAGADPRGIDALDAFSHHGGFGLHLLRAGARSARAGRHVGGGAGGGRPRPPRGTACRADRHRADAFERLRALEREGQRFGAISVDPPALAKRARDLERAMAGYKELNLRAMRLLRPGGVLGTSSCSAHLQEAEFLNVLSDAAADAGRRCTCSGATGRRPITPSASASPRARYLKFVLLRAMD